MLQRRTRNKIALFAVPLATALVIGLGALRTPATDGTLTLEASLSTKKLTVRQDAAIVNQYNIQKIVWNPAWVPPDAKWAQGKSAKAPGHPANPMKLVKIFWKEPDYYIHGTGDVESLGSAASHGCLRMDPDEVMEVGKWVMEHGGSPQEENWFWRILHFRNEEKVIYLSQPIPIKVVE